MQTLSANPQKKEMQTKINAFFKPRSLPQIPQDCNAGQLIQDQENSRNDTIRISTNPTESAGCTIQVSAAPENISTSSKNINNKRSYAQLHLDLGQSDFLLRLCSTCGFKYACGDKVDEKLHKDFHKDYTHGIEFKGWQNERVVRTLPGDVGRVLLVLDEDPPAHKKKVEKVLQMMEVEIGSGSLMRKNCQIYLYIFQRRVVGCLIVQSISEAFKVVTKSQTPKCADNSITKTRQDSSVLNFGGFQMQREVRAKSASSNKDAALSEDLMGAIFIDKEPIPAVCGVRAIWVVTAMRRKHIASQLLDTARMNFLKGTVLDHSQLAFSDPTSAGRALALRYCGSSFLAYKADL